MTPGSVNRRGPKRSRKSLAAERATTTRRIKAGKFTAPPPGDYRVVSRGGDRFRPVPATTLVNPFLGFKFNSPTEMIQAIYRWRILNRPPTKASPYLPDPENPWVLTVAYEGDDGVARRGTLSFPVMPDEGEITLMMAETWSGDPRYPETPTFIGVDLVRYLVD